MFPRNDYSDNVDLDTIVLMGTIFATIGYGVVCALYGITFGDRRHWKMWCLRTWLVILATVAVALQIRWTVVAFVLERNYTGGPHAFVEQNDGDWVNVMLNATYVILSWSADSVLLFRCYIIYTGTARLYMILPVLMFITNLVVGSLFLRQLAGPGTFQYTEDRVDFLVAYRTVSLALSAVGTGLIVGRILYHRREMRSLVKSTSDRRLTSVCTMLVESEALETVTALVYIILVGIGSPGQNVVLPILGQVQVMAPLVIFYRVSLGQAWSKDTAFTLSQPTFGPQGPKLYSSPLSTAISLNLPTIQPSTYSSGAYDKPRLSITSSIGTMSLPSASSEGSPTWSEEIFLKRSPLSCQGFCRGEKRLSWTDSILGP